MPASKFTKKANTPKKSRQWQHVYESEIERGASKGTAIKAASGVLKHGKRSQHFHKGSSHGG